MTLPVDCDVAAASSLPPRLVAMRQRILDHQPRLLRQAASPDVLSECEHEQLSWMQRSARLTSRMCAAEIPVITPGERICFTRTISNIPPIYAPGELEALTSGYTIHESGPINNICADWGMALSHGLLRRKQTALATRRQKSNDPQALEFLDSTIETIDAVLDLASRYARAAAESGRPELAVMLLQVPANAPRTFHEALQSLRLLHAVAWLSGHYQVCLGRFDQYMYPYLRADIESGRLDLDSALELLAEFFILLNKDSDIYPGVQQGDNGQTLTIGGVTPSGDDACNPLTGLCLRAARDVAMIDPKINLRISAGTDLDLLCLASELTRKGLGFPQYSNDDVVIPALAAHGYAIEDARDYTVAACWEFIIPGKGMEVVNIGAVSFPYAADQAIRQALGKGEDFPSILERTRSNIRQQIDALLKTYSRLFLPPAPYHSLLMSDCLETGRDISQGAKYNNYGIHGAGSANAADALAAVQHFVFNERSISPAALLEALENNFDGAEELRGKLAKDGPKVGCNSPAADDLLVYLFDAFADICESAPPNPKGGLVRPGAGSAMYYIWLTQGYPGMREPIVGATAEGRKSGEPLSANLSPSLGVQASGPFSIFRSFSKINYRRICNGGPITLELSDSVFRTPESIRQAALFVRSFAQLGCQQLQINSLNAATLLAAKANPERHRNLIVRVWGWSGYFCELDLEYQSQVIRRVLYSEFA